MKQNKNMVYVVEVIIRNDKTGELLSETVGVYDSLSLAEEYRRRCENDLSPEEQNFILYDVRGFVLNRMPDVMRPERQEAEELTLRQLSSGLNIEGVEPDMFEEAIIKMMNEGLVDQLIGDDGEFYYQLTEEGKKAGKDLFLQDLQNELEEEDEEGWQSFGSQEWSENDEEDEEDDDIDWKNFL